MKPTRIIRAVGLCGALASTFACHEPARESPVESPVEQSPTAAAQPIELAEPTVPEIFAAALTGHRKARYTADLTGIKKRGLIRVGMLNNGASYFIYRGQEVGFGYELAGLLAARLGVRLEPVVPSEPRAMLDLLRDGRADVVPYSPSEGRTTPDDFRLTDGFIFADHVIVQRADEEPITKPEQLAGRQVYARATSSYYPFLERLLKSVPTLEIVRAREDQETEELIDAVATGKIPLTVANTNLLATERTYRTDVVGTLKVATDRPLAYAVRADAAQLFARLTRFVAEEPPGARYREIYARYFENPKRMAQVQPEQAALTGAISPYDDLAKKYGTEHDIDWRLIVAQMYQESRFDPQARSFAGARGLMQLMPRTAEELGVRNILDPEQNVAGGVRYMKQLIARFDAKIPMRQRVRFALASYNAGLEHVRDARVLAKQRRLDPNRWFGHVEQAMLLLEKRHYYRRARRGYCRGREPVAYVSRIQSKYEAYVALTPKTTEVTGAPEPAQP